jgi:hypothetical protein
VGESPCAFFSGFIFGSLGRENRRRAILYAAENGGNVFGALVAFVLTLIAMKNIGIVLIAALPLILGLHRRKVLFLSVLLAFSASLFLHDRSIEWKYRIPVSSVHQGRNGEFATVVHGADTTLLLNGMLYKSTLDRALIEQSVHLPLSQRPYARLCLVIYNRGHTHELKKYPALAVDIVESEPYLAEDPAQIEAPETFDPGYRYDIVFIGSTIPENVATNRFYTHTFFRTISSRMTDSAIITFTLPFQHNYLNQTEQLLFATIKSTLLSVFDHLFVFPGNGYTFMASNHPLSPHRITPRVPTNYLSSFIIPSVSPRRITEANRRRFTDRYINTVSRPVALFIALKRWLDRFELSTVLFFGLIVGIGALGIVFLPRRTATLSIGTSGFAAALTSVSIMLLYQSTYGALYSRVALLMMALTVGFTIGSRAKRFPLADAAIGFYCFGALIALIRYPYVPLALYFIVLVILGVLCGAQFVTEKTENTPGLYAADLFGGVIGMALSSTLFIPLFGIDRIAGALLGIKCLAEVVWVLRNRTV